MFVQAFIIMSTGVAVDVYPGGPLDSTGTIVILIYFNAFQFLKMG